MLFRSGGWQGQRDKTRVKDEPALTAERRARIGWDNPVQDRLHVGWRVPSSVDDPKNAALGLLLKAYVFSDSSELWKQVVLDEQLAENVESWWSPHKDASLFAVAARVKDKKNPDDVLLRIQTQLDNLSAGKINDRRFTEVKSHLKYSLLMGLTSPSSISSALAEYAGPAFDAGFVDGAYGALEVVTPKDLQAFAQAHLQKSQRAVVVLHHDDAAASAAKKDGAK